MNIEQPIQYFVWPLPNLSLNRSCRIRRLCQTTLPPSLHFGGRSKQLSLLRYTSAGVANNSPSFVTLRRAHQTTLPPSLHFGGRSKQPSLLRYTSAGVANNSQTTLKQSSNNPQTTLKHLPPSSLSPPDGPSRPASANFPSA